MMFQTMFQSLYCRLLIRFSRHLFIKTSLVFLMIFLRYTTHTALFDLVNQISLDVDMRKIVTGVFLDLAKTFDTVDHHLLLEKLGKSRIRGVVQKLFRCYLTNRLQYVSANNIDSPRVLRLLGSVNKVSLDRYCF